MNAKGSSARWLAAFLCMTVLLLAACSGGDLSQARSASNSTATTPATAQMPSGTTTAPGTPTTPGSTTSTAANGTAFFWSIPFSVSGLSEGANLVVLLNGTYARTITANLSPPNGSFLYVPGAPAGYLGLPNGTSYSITVGTQPSGETCAVESGSGTLTASSAPVEAAINCVSVTSQASSTVVRANVPSTISISHYMSLPARQGAASFVDSHGNFWLFGGSSNDSTGTVTYFNDLWRSSPDSVSSNRITSQDLKLPSARAYAATWTDASGDFWMFGGSAVDQQGKLGALNDLWRFSVATSLWTSAGSSADAPGARSGAVSWTDSAGTMWLYGGQDVDSNGATRTLGDLWAYTPSSGTWALVRVMRGTAGPPSLD